MPNIPVTRQEQDLDMGLSMMMNQNNWLWRREFENVFIESEKAYDI